MTPLRLIQVGAGSMGRAWLRTVADAAEVELVGVVDLEVDAARRAVAEAGIPAVPVGASMAELLPQVVTDAVLDVTVPAAHRQVATAALRAGLPVLSEKPLAESVASGLAMIAAAELSGRLLMVSQSRRYYRQLTAFRRQIAEIGPVGLLHCDFFRGPRFGGFRETMGYPLLLDMAVHQLDLARDLVGADPVSVHCTSSNPPWSWFAGDAAAQVAVTFSGGAVFGFSGSWVSLGQETSWNGSWRADGAGGSASWDGTHQPVAAAADGRPLPAVPGEGPEEIAGSLADFVDALRTGRTPSGAAHTNVLSLAMVEGAVRSARENRSVTIAEVLEDAYRAALATEPDPDIRGVLRSWPSVQDVVGRAAEAAQPAGR